MTKKFYYKIHESESGYLLSACDVSICGKKINDEDIDFYVNPRFYKDKSANDKEMLRLFSSVSNANLVGKNIVELAIKNKFIKKQNVVNISGIPHAQVVVMKI